jgi:glycosyltransferase involved in cell wall biosynthesis
MIPTFVLNEILELKALKHEVFIWTDKMDRVSGPPILIKNELFDKTYCGFSFRSKGRRRRLKKLIYLIKKLIYDFSSHPIITIKALIYLMKLYPNLGNGTEAYIHVRHFFRFNIDIIHAPFSVPDIIEKVYLLSKIINVPFTLAFRMHDIYGRDNLHNRDNLHKTQEMVKILRESSQIITISKSNENYLKSSHVNWKDIEIEIIHSSIDPILFKPKNISKSSKSIISVCRLSEEKGIIYLLQACHILNQRKIEYDCTLIGDGPERIKYEKLVDELQIPNINFMGDLTYDEVKLHLDNSTIFVLPSIISANGLRDVLPNALKEAMAMQVPVITSDTRGIEELVDDGINGIIVPPKDPKSIADSIEKLFNDPNLRKRMGEAGRKKIEKDFNTEIEVSKLNRIFNEAVRNKRNKTDLVS